MASPAHCFYCFECLSSLFTSEEPPKLSVLEDLWDEFEVSNELNDEDDGTQNGLGPSRTSAVGLEAEAEGAVTAQQANGLSRAPKLPSIGRLQEPSASLGSPNSSTPSALSTSSSRSILTNATSVTSLSSDTPSSAKSKVSSGFQFLKSSAGSTYPLFVTWNTVSRSGHKSLRGCIGTFEAQELTEGLKTYALTSAFGDTRFSPIQAHLLPSLSCSLTILSSFEPCIHALDWDLGTHGIRVSFIHRGRRYGATYLPDVPVEQGWTREETVESLMRKAGWDGNSGIGQRFLQSGAASSMQNRPWDDVLDFKSIRYQGLKASANYAEWQEWRKWAQEML